jgi:hypothetical protein
MNLELVAGASSSLNIFQPAISHSQTLDESPVTPIQGTTQTVASVSHDPDTQAGYLTPRAVERGARDDDQESTPDKPPRGKKVSRSRVETSGAAYGQHSEDNVQAEAAGDRLPGDGKDNPLEL